VVVTLATIEDTLAAVDSVLAEIGLEAAQVAQKAFGVDQWVGEETPGGAGGGVQCVKPDSRERPGRARARPGGHARTGGSALLRRGIFADSEEP